MKDAFFSIKRKFLINAIIISTAIGLSVGLLAVGALMLIFKLTQTEFNPLWYVLIGVGGALFVGGTLFLILLPTNKRLAKHLDEKLSLNEKVQTMVEFDGKDGEMIKLQRLDTDKRLKSVPAKVFSLKRWWVYLVAVVIAMGTFGTAFFIPEKEIPEDDTPPEVEFDATEWQIKRLEQLIKDVKNSKNFYKEAKEQIVVELEELLETMRLDYVSENQIINQVLDVIVKIHEIIDDLISYNDIGEFMKESSSDINVQNLATGILTLNYSTVLNRLKDIRETFRGYYIEVEEPEEEKLVSPGRGMIVDKTSESGGARSVVESREGDDLDEDEEAGKEEPKTEFVDLFGQELFDTIISFTSLAKLAVDAPGMQEDSLFIKLNAFFDELAILADNIDNIPTENAQAQLDAFFEESSSKTVYDIKIEIENQSNNRFERDNVVKKLLEIFGLTEDDLPDSIKNQLEQEKLYSSIISNDDKNDDDTLHGGGGGTGDIQFGSNDLIYDPDDDQHVHYGEVVIEWFSEEVAKMEEANVPQEIIELYKKFYDEYLMGKQDSESGEIIN